MSKVAKFPVQEGLHVTLTVGADITLITTKHGNVTLEPDDINIEVEGYGLVPLYDLVLNWQVTDGAKK